MEQAVSRLSQPGDTASATEAVLAASIYACEALHRVSQTVQQVHGGTGVDRDYPLFRYCLMAKKLEMVLGGQSALIARLGVILAND
ncbi:Acyl-CoA dehydrogenase FadE27 [compost metagenome]